jgi:hypothetical protein
VSDDATETTVGGSLREHAYALLSAALTADKAGADVAVAPDAARKLASGLFVAARRSKEINSDGVRHTDWAARLRRRLS